MSSDGRRSAEINWDSATKSVAWFKLSIRDAFNIAEGQTFLLLDMEGCTCVISPSLPLGTYALLETNCVETIGSIINRGDHERERSMSQHVEDGDAGAKRPNEHQQQPSENFEQNLLRIACADAMIANERTYLAWTRTSLSIMVCCFTFTFLDDWSVRARYTKILSNSVVLLFALAFLGCFIVGYVRYRMFSRLLRTSAFSSNFSELDVDWSSFQMAWMLGTGVTLVFSSFVFLGVLKRDFFGS